MRRILTVVALVVLASAAGADVVELKGGTRIEGDVLESGARVRILLPGGDEVLLAKADVKTVTIEPDGPGRGHFARYTTEDKKPGLQTGVIHYEKAGSPRVDLVGAVHVADASYFAEIQSVLDRADVVLYEMVRNRDELSATKPAPAADPAEDLSALRKFQMQLGQLLDLTFQVDGIDYRRKHFVHADMTLDEFMAQGGDKISKEMADQMARIAPLLDMIVKALAPAEGSSELRKYLAKGVRGMVKRMIASMLGSLDESGMVLGGVNVDELIITKRNEVCMAMFDVVSRNRGAKSIAIFYGAAHMPDFEKRLVSRGYQRVGGHWLTAWDLSEKPAAPPAKPAPPPPAPTPVPAMK